MTAKRALITGIGGQDGSLLAELLLELDYEVFGIVLRAVRAESEPRRNPREGPSDAGRPARRSRWSML